MPDAPSDMILVLLYRLFSQEQWASDWIGDPSVEPHRTDFVRWLRVQLDQSIPDRASTGSPEGQSLGTLRELWNIAFPPDTPPQE